MKEEGDPKFDHLVEQAREKDGLSDPRWEALARGELSDEEAALLENEAPYEAFRPLDATERSALADGVFAALDAQPKSTGTEEAPPPKTQTPQTPQKEPQVIPLRPWIRRVTLLLAAALAVFGLWFFIRPPSLEPIAAYTLAVEGGNQAQRSDPSAPQSVLMLDPDSRLSLALRPETPMKGAIALRAFVVREGAARPWDAPAMVGAGGVIRIEGKASLLFGELPEGAWDIVLVVARPEAIPDDKALEEAVVHQEKIPNLSLHRQKIVLLRPRGKVELNPEATDEQSLVFSGCATVRAGGDCELGPKRTLQFFVPKALPERVIVRADKTPIGSSSTVLGHGVRLRVDVPESARSLSISLDLPGDSRERTLNLVEGEAFPAWIAEATAARKRGKLEQAESLLREMSKEAPAAARREALRQKARIALASPGRFPEAKALFRQAIDEDRRAGRISDELDDSFALAYGLLLQERAFGEARSLLEDLGPLLKQCPEGKPKTAYYMGLIALETGDLRGALAFFKEAERGAERLGLDDYRSGILEQEADLLSSLGRHDEARTRLDQARRLAGNEAGVCRRAELASNQGWIALRAGALRGEGLEEAKRALSEALSTAREGCPTGLGNILVNLSLTELYMGHPEAARAHAAEAKRAGGWAGLSAWQRMIEARLLLQDAKGEEALKAYDALRDEGERFVLPELSFEGALGRAEALEALGRVKDAREAHAEAARSLSAWGQNVPLGEGRATFLLAHRRAAQGAIAFFLGQAERGDKNAKGEAMDAARKSILSFARAFHWLGQVNTLSAEARKSWDEAVARYRGERAILEEKAASQGPGASGLENERSRLRQALDRALAALNAQRPAETELSLPGPDEALLVMHPLREGIAAFLMSEGGASIEARRLPMTDRKASAQALAEAWLVPFQKTLNQPKLRRLRLALSGELADIDWHALPLNGTPLIEKLSVLYTLDLETFPGQNLEEQGTMALVVADPTEDLPGARASADEVARSLQSRGMKVLRLGGQAASHEAVRDALALPQVKVLHYAGHAIFEGPDGLEAAFRLAKRAHFSAADIMALPRVPEIVVLAGCETARSGEAARGGGLGLAQAFLMKGARVALATPRPMGDAWAERATRLLYENQLERDPEKALQNTIKTLHLESPAEDWASLRMLVAGF